ncbi:MAG: L-threonylcarbamoyladenylate synthase [Bacteroidota bacterium]
MAQIVKDISLVKDYLDSEELVAIPTETVYGLAAKGTSTKALKKIFEAKGRPTNNPLILHFKDLESITPFVTDLTDEISHLASQFWPGPLTLLLPKSQNVPVTVTAGSNRVAVRVPNHPITLELLKTLDYPLAAPSANPSGYISPTRPEHVEIQLGGKVGLILDGGPCTSGIESTIVGWENGTPIIYRKGLITSEQLGEVLGKRPEFKGKSHILEAPGMLSSHYAPNTKTVVTEKVKESVGIHKNKRIGLLTFKQPMGLKVEKEIVLTRGGSLEEMAKNLYAAMHKLDAMGLHVIIIEKAPDKGIGKAINDRLLRSSTKL